MRIPFSFAPLLVFLSGSLFATPPAFAWDLAVVGGFNFSHPSLNPDPPPGTEISTKAAFGFGALGAFSLGEDYLFESGLIRHGRGTMTESATASTETRYSGWLVPLTFRFMRAEFLGLGFGPYFALLDGGDANRKRDEFGFRVNLRLAFPAYRSAKIVLDGSYLFGFTDLNKSAIGEDKTQDLVLLVGLQIPIGVGSPASPSPGSAADTGSSIAPPERPSEPGPVPSPKPSPKSKPRKEKRK